MHRRLVIRRTEGQRVFIGDITVMVKHCRQGSVRLCIDADESVNIRREELELRDRADSRVAVEAGKDGD